MNEPTDAEIVDALIAESQRPAPFMVDGVVDPAGQVYWWVEPPPGRRLTIREIRDTPTVEHDGGLVAVLVVSVFLVGIAIGMGLR